jgi:hypothetical protein
MPFHTLIGGVNGVGTRDAGIPRRTQLDVNYPNPFNPSTVVSCQLSVASNVKLGIYDLLGREVAVLLNERKEPGRYSFRWNAEGNASGVYLCRMLAGGITRSIRMLYLR